MEKLPLRERKKVQTRQRILQAAAKLVSKRGYEAATIAAICDEADIAPRTFFSYFPSKEAVFFYDMQLLHDYIEDRLIDRPAGQTTFEALRELLSPALDRCLAHNSYAITRQEQDLQQSNQQLQMYYQYLNQQFERMFQQCLARDLDEPEESLSVKLAAAAANTTLEAIMNQRAMQQAVPNKQEIVETLDKALVFLEAGVATLRQNEQRP